MRRLVLALGLACLLSSLSAEPAPPPVTVRYVVPGADYPDGPRVLEAVNRKLQADGLNLRVAVQYVPWDAWQNKTGFMFATGEAFDLIQIMENWVPTATFVGRGALRPIDDLLDRWGPNLRRALPEVLWNATKVDGRIYSVPALWRSSTGIQAEGSGFIVARRDKLTQFGLSLPRNPDEVLELGKTLQDRWRRSSGETVYFWDHNVLRSPAWLHRTYASWPFTTETELPLVKVDSAGRVTSWLESPEFRADTLWYRKAYQTGLYDPEVLTVPKEERDTLLNQGKYLLAFGTTGLTMTPTGWDKAYFPTQFLLAPDKPTPVSLPVLNSNGVSVTSRHPEAAIQFLNWLYASEENHDLFLYGLPGTHYRPVDRDRIDVTLDAAKRPLYEHPWWMLAYYKWAKYSRNALSEEIELGRSLDPHPPLSPVYGFHFNPAPVAAEQAELLSLYPQVVLPLRWGLVDYAQAYPALLARMKAAGLTRYVAEYARQFQAFQARQKGPAP